MHAAAGDRIIIEGHRIGEPSRDGEIIEVRGHDADEHYVVRWEDGHESVFFPGPDAAVQHFDHAAGSPG